MHGCKGELINRESVFSNKKNFVQYRFGQGISKVLQSCLGRSHLRLQAKICVFSKNCPQTAQKMTPDPLFGYVAENPKGGESLILFNLIGRGNLKRRTPYQQAGN